VALSFVQKEEMQSFLSPVLDKSALYIDASRVEMLEKENSFRLVSEQV